MLNDFKLNRSIKTGLNISGDAKKLYEDYGLQVRGCVELTHLIKKKCKFYSNLEIESQSIANKKVHLDRLDGLVYLLLNGLDMEKNKSITMSNWENNPLTIKQIEYAANDAILSFYVFIQAIINLNNTTINSNVSHFNDFFQIKHQSISKCSNNNVPMISFDVINNTLSKNNILKICYGIIDVKILKLERKVNNQLKNNKSKSSLSSISSNSSSSNSWSFSSVSDISNLDNCEISVLKQKEAEKAKLERKKRYRALASRKKPLYDNCKLLKKDGTLIATCSAKTLEWYLKKGIARAHESDPKAIYLKFEPNTKRHSADKFYQTGKKNICVVCGADDNLVRYYIVPQCYRKLFPKRVKNHSSHDIVLLCNNDNTECHNKANLNEENLRAKLSKEYNIIQWNAKIKDFCNNGHIKKKKKHTNDDNKNNNDNNDGEDEDSTDDFELKQYISRCAKILCKQKDKLPQQRRDQLLAVIAKYYGLIASGGETNNDQENEKKKEQKQDVCNTNDSDEGFFDGYDAEKIDSSLFELDKVDDQVIKNAIDLAPDKREENRIRKEIFQVHCKQLVACFKNDYHCLIRLWRQSFLDNLKPKFLPKHWSVDSEY